MLPDIDKVTALLREVAEGEILPRFNRLGEGDRWEKRPGSWVTVADMAAEARLIEGLTALVPGSRVVGEEGAEDDPAVLELLDGDGRIWIVDPLDGTSNFAAGKPRFAIMVAYVEGGQTRAGWIHDPLGGRTAVAIAGEGAFIGAERLSVAGAARHEEMTVSLGGRIRRQGGIAHRFAEVTNTSCCGVDYLALATGAVHAAHYRRLKPWDHAPGELIFREAGGFAARFDGGPYRPGDQPEGGMLLAPNEACWHALRPVIQLALDALG